MTLSMTQAVQACDLCGSSEFRQIGDRDRHGQPLSTVICTQCGLVRHEQVPTEQELAEFYSTSYRSEYNGESSPGTRRVMRAWNNGRRICSQVAPLLEKSGRVLEVGAGIGCTVKVFEQAGFRAEGIDPGGEFLNFSRDKLAADVRICSLKDVPRDGSFDAVLLVHVIEHLRSPRESIEYITGLLKPGGMLYVECPNLQAPFARRSKLFHKAHIHNFVPQTLQVLAESCGYRLRARFGDAQDPNLQMLFQHTGERLMHIDPLMVRRILADLDASNALPYHLRWRYLSDRIAKVGSYAREHLTSGRFVRNVIKDCGCDERRVA